MGSVFLCTHLKLGRQAALKILKVLSPDPVENQRYLETLMNEGKLLSGLDHPGLARVLDFSETSGQPYLAMEFIQGSSLRERIEDTGKPFCESIRVWRTRGKLMIRRQST